VHIENPTHTRARTLLIYLGVVPWYIKQLMSFVVVVLGLNYIIWVSKLQKVSFFFGGPTILLDRQIKNHIF
jgi:hypothetical protein